MHPVLISYPDYTMGNAYQHLVYKSYSGRVVYGDIDAAIETAKESGPCVFHVNWLNQIIKSDRKESETLAKEFKEKVEQLQLCGAKLVWTIHNLLGHTTRDEDADFEIAFRRWLAEIADLVILHKPSHLTMIQKTYRCNLKRCYFHEHGLYEIQSRVIPSELIEETGIRPESKVISLLGQIRPYKGISEAVDIFNALSESTNRDIVFLIAGAVEWAYRDEVNALLATVSDQSRLVCVKRRLDDSELCWLTEASSVVLLPYIKILNSGSLRYNQTLGKISAIPSRHQALFQDEPGILFYSDPNDAASQIKIMLEDATWNSPKHSEEIKDQAHARLCWPNFTAIMSYI